MSKAFDEFLLGPEIPGLASISIRPLALPGGIPAGEWEWAEPDYRATINGREFLLNACYRDFLADLDEELRRRCSDWLPFVGVISERHGDVYYRCGVLYCNSKEVAVKGVLGRLVDLVSGE